MNVSIYKERYSSCGCIDILARPGDEKDLANMAKVVRYLVEQCGAEEIAEGHGPHNIIVGCDGETVDELREIYREAKRSLKK